MDGEGMTVEQLVAELFFSYRYAKRLLQAAFPVCLCNQGTCRQPTVGCHVYTVYGGRQHVAGRCAEHWPFAEGPGANPLPWRVRWDHLEDAEVVTQVTQAAQAQKGEEQRENA